MKKLQLALASQQWSLYTQNFPEREAGSLPVPGGGELHGHGWHSAFKTKVRNQLIGLLVLEEIYTFFPLRQGLTV